MVERVGKIIGITAIGAGLLLIGAYFLLYGGNPLSSSKLENLNAISSLNVPSNINTATAVRISLRKKVPEVNAVEPKSENYLGPKISEHATDINLNTTFLLSSIPTPPPSTIQIAESSTAVTPIQNKSENTQVLMKGYGSEIFISQMHPRDWEDPNWSEIDEFANFKLNFEPIEVNNEIDVLVHLQEISYSRVNHPDEIFNIGEKHNLLVISVDKEKLQVGCSLKQLSPDPFEHISNYEINKKYKVKVVKIMDFGLFAELEPGLTTLLHSSELSWTKKNPSAKKMFKVNDQIDCVITEIDKEKRRVAVSHRLTLENPYHLLEKKHPVGSEVEGIISSINEYAIYLKIDNLDINAFLHYNDLTYAHNGEEELKKYKKGDKLKVKVLEIKIDQQKIRVGLKQTQIDPFSWFKDKKLKDRITVKVISSDNKGLIVKPEGCEIDFTIKKSQIAINNADARPSRFVGGERIDVAISELDKEKRKVGLSIKLLEELQNKEAVSRFSSTLSGKNLPFSSLSDKLENKKKKKE